MLTGYVYGVRFVQLFFKEMDMIDVPIFYQPRGSRDCGPACVKMVLAYHKIKLSLKSITNALPMLSDGIDIASLGIFFLDYDFDVSIKLWLQEWPSSFWLECNFGDGFEKQLRWWCRRSVVKLSIGRKIYRKSFPKFLEKGGRIIPSPISLKDTKDSLKLDPDTGKASPCILNLRVSNPYNSGKTKDIGHYVVPVHVDDKFIGINDPDRQYGGRVKLYPVSALIHTSSFRFAALLPRIKKQA